MLACWPRPSSPAHIDMKNPRIIAVSLLALVLVACNGQAPNGDGTKDTAHADAPAKQASGNRLSAAQVAAIAASGKTGLWSDPSELCAGKARGQATLAWNVKDTGVRQVNLYLVGRNGKERRFASGGPIGGKMSGRWLMPGTAFVLRASNDAHELGRVVIGKKQC